MTPQGAAEVHATIPAASWVALNRWTSFSLSYISDKMIKTKHGIESIKTIRQINTVEETNTKTTKMERKQTV